MAQKNVSRTSKTGASSFHRVIVFDGFDILSQLLFVVKRFIDEISVIPQNRSFCVLL